MLKNLLVLLSVTTLFSCSQKPTIQIAGSTTVLPIISKAAEQYKLNHPELKIIVNPGGSGVGINQLGEGKIALAMASRDITESEINQFPKVTFMPQPVGKDAVVPSVSSEIYDAGVTTLSLKQIGDIYSGRISNWQELGGPNKEILCIDKEKSRGTRHIFMQHVLGNKEAEAPGADLVLGSNNEEQTALAQSDAAIGMLSNAWLSNDVKGLNILTENGDTISPSIQNVVNGIYPISRDLLIISNGKPSPETQKFIDFLFSNAGQEIVKDCGYVSVNQ